MDWEPFTDAHRVQGIVIVANIIVEPEKHDLIQKADDAIKESKAVIKETKEAIKETAAVQASFKNAPKMEKRCELCGKPFHPNSEVQKYCAECKRMKDDIKRTARELLET